MSSILCITVQQILLLLSASPTLISQSFGPRCLDRKNHSTWTCFGPRHGLDVFFSANRRQTHESDRCHAHLPSWSAKKPSTLSHASCPHSCCCTTHSSTLKAAQGGCDLPLSPSLKQCAGRGRHPLHARLNSLLSTFKRLH